MDDPYDVHDHRQHRLSYYPRFGLYVIVLPPSLLGFIRGLDISAMDLFAQILGTAPDKGDVYTQEVHDRVKECDAQMRVYHKVGSLTSFSYKQRASVHL